MSKEETYNVREMFQKAIELMDETTVKINELPTHDERLYAILKNGPMPMRHVWVILCGSEFSTVKGADFESTREFIFSMLDAGVLKIGPLGLTWCGPEPEEYISSIEEEVNYE